MFFFYIKKKNILFLIECMESLLCKVLLLWKHVFLLTVTKMKSYLVCITLLFHKFSENCRGSSRQSISLQPFAFLQQKTEEEGLGGLRIFSLEKRRLGEISSISIENRREDAKRTKPGSALFIGAQGQDKTQWSKSGTQKSSFWTPGCTFVLYTREHSHRLPEKLQSVGDIQKQTGRGPGQLAISS